MRGLGRRELGHRRFDARPLLAILRVGRLPRQHARRFEVRRDVGQHPLHGFVPGNRLTERVPRPGKGDGFGDGRLADAERLRRHTDASALQRPHRQAEALVNRAEHLLVGHLDVEVEIHAAEPSHAERVGASRTRDPGRVHRHQERGDALPALAWTGAGKHNRHCGDVGIGHPHLSADDAVAVAGALGAGLLVGGVGAGVGLGKREGGQRLTRGETAQPFVLLPGTSGMRQQVRHQRVMHDHGYAHRGAGSRRSLRWRYCS